MTQTIPPHVDTAVISIASSMTLWGLQRIVGRRRDRRGLRAQVVALCARYELGGRRAADGDMPRWLDDEAGALSAFVTSKEGRDALYGRDYGRLCELANSVKDDIVALQQGRGDVAAASSALVRDAHGARLLLGDYREVLDGRPLHLAVSWRSHARKYATVAAGTLVIWLTLWTLIGSAMGSPAAFAVSVASIGAGIGAIWITRVKRWAPRFVRARIAERRNAGIENLAKLSLVGAFTALSMSGLHQRMDLALHHASPAGRAVYALSWDIVVGLFGGVALYWLVRQVRRIADLHAGITEVDALQMDGVCRAAAELPDVHGLTGCGCTGLECLARRYRV